MELNEWLRLVAHTKPSELEGDDGDVYYSNFDDSYITRVGMEDNVKFLAERNITEQLTHGVGFSPSENKWYGWSHRAIFGFTIGSTCSKGDCHYRASNIEEEIEKARLFWTDAGYDITGVEDDGEGTISISWKYNETAPNESLHNTIGGVEWGYDSDNFGRGEWAAETMEDAKQMAIDFNEGVS